MITGYVKKINTKEGKGRRGPWTLYSGILELDNGQETGWISFGFDAPPFKEGSYVSIETQQTDRGQDYVKGSYKAAEPPKSVAAPAATGEGQASAPRGPSLSGAAKDASIQYQSSRKDALTLVSLLLEHHALPISASTAKAGEAKRYAEIKAFVDKLTVEFYGDVQTGRVLQQVVDSGATTDSDSGASTATSQEDND